MILDTSEFRSNESIGKVIPKSLQAMDSEGIYEYDRII